MSRKLLSFSASLAALPALLTSACSENRLPEGFAFGTAVAGFQVDMGCPTLPASECEDPRSDWFQFATSTVTVSNPNNHLSGQPLADGPGFYELYQADLDRMQSLGLTHLRLSIEWSRIFPESTRGVEGQVALRERASPSGLAYYRRLLAAMKARGIRPLVTLHHYTLPAWIHDAVGCNQNLRRCTRRGWLEPDLPAELAKYAGFVAAELGGEIDQWVTENEPLAVVVPGFIQPTAARTNPPARAFALDEAQVAALAMVRAHALMVDAIRANDQVDADGDGRATDVGLVFNVTPFRPKDPGDGLDLRAAKNVTTLFNWIFLDAVILGQHDPDFDGTGELDPALVGRIDFLGVNYYTVGVLQGSTDSVLAAFSPLATFNPLTLEQGAVVPEGFLEALDLVRERYPELRLIISENGADSVTYPEMDRFVAEHFQYLRRAIDRGAKVEGYYFWSLLDNYEWNHGMSQKFGLYAVDPRDPQKLRTPRASAEAYRQIVAGRGDAEELYRRFPIPEGP